MMKFLKKYYWIFFSVLIVIADQISKYFVSRTLTLYKDYTIIPNFFSFTYVKNEGIAFGMLSRFGAISKVIVAIVTFAVIVFAIYAICKGYLKNTLGVVSVAMIVGGGIGNLIDRLLLHYVVDFFSFTFGGWRFAIFNVADIFVSVGTVLFLIYFIFFDAKKELEEDIEDGNQEV